jgi:hypothetical protein
MPFVEEMAKRVYHRIRYLLILMALVIAILVVPALIPRLSANSAIVTATLTKYETAMLEQRGKGTFTGQFAFNLSL